MRYTAVNDGRCAAFHTNIVCIQLKFLNVLLANEIYTQIQWSMHLSITFIRIIYFISFSRNTSNTSNTRYFITTTTTKKMSIERLIVLFSSLLTWWSSPYVVHSNATVIIIVICAFLVI